MTPLFQQTNSHKVWLCPMIQGMSYQQLNWQMKERLTKRDQPSILYDASQSVFSGDGLISESVNEDELQAAW